VLTLRAFKDASVMETPGSYGTTVGVSMLSLEDGDIMVVSAISKLL